ncbi:MAG: PIN domain-containing protein [Spirochaetaceae bacterium]|nr:MAG: PIN domain-containing protein [Spirochaetaceae bacterium]
MRIFLDANILFSAAFSNGAIRRLIHDIRNASHTVVVNRYVIDEALRNISIHRSESLAILHEITASMEVVPTRLKLPTSVRGIALPEKDVPVLATALSSRCDVLMTGDVRHFGTLFGTTVGGTAIHSPVGTARMLFGG